MSQRISQKTALRTTAAVGAAGVALGAFGAHALKDFLLAGERMQTWETAVFYHLIHTIVMLVMVCRSRWQADVWMIFASGVLIFSGSLYLLCLSGISWLGAITPIGGLLLIAGWIRLGFIEFTKAT